MQYNRSYLTESESKTGVTGKKEANTIRRNMFVSVFCSAMFYSENHKQSVYLPIMW